MGTEPMQVKYIHSFIQIVAFSYSNYKSTGIGIGVIYRPCQMNCDYRAYIHINFDILINFILTSLKKKKDFDILSLSPSSSIHMNQQVNSYHPNKYYKMVK